jgi:hypothetical protein
MDLYYFLSTIENMQMMHTILVPQGAEYQAVCCGVSRVTADQPQVIAIPNGDGIITPIFSPKLPTSKSATTHGFMWQLKSVLWDW